jgi:hypothetical protein
VFESLGFGIGAPFECGAVTAREIEDTHRCVLPVLRTAQSEDCRNGRDDAERESTETGYQDIPSGHYGLIIRDHGGISL